MYSLLYEERSVIRLMLEDVVKNNFDSVRFWCFDHGNTSKLKDSLQYTLNIISELKLKAIPVLSDQWGFIKNYNMDLDWYKNGYRSDFMPFAIDMVKEFKNRNEIILWELINEPACDSYEIFHKFVEDSTSELKNVNENHLLSLGTIGGIGNKFGGPFSRFSLKKFERLYSIKSLDTVSLHDYSYDSTILDRLDILFRFGGKNFGFLGSLNNFFTFLPSKIDEYYITKLKKARLGGINVRRIWKNYNFKQIDSAKKLEKPVYIGEAGYKKILNNRPEVIKIEADNLFRHDISGILLWSFESNGKSIDGHGYGFGNEDNLGETVKNIKDQIL